jgi:hypothetical protein
LLVWNKNAAAVAALHKVDVGRWQDAFGEVIDRNVFAGFWGSDPSVSMDVDNMRIEVQEGSCPPPENPAGQ